jgi:hypothetical protein
MSKLPYQPYTYIIGWRTHNVWYYGSESAQITKQAHPSNLWTTYFTSSDVVTLFRQQHGEPDVVRVVKTFESAYDARAAESQYLTRLNAAQRPNWLNQHNGADKFHTSGLKMVTNGKETKCIDPSNGVPKGWRFGVDDKTRANKRSAILKREVHFTSLAYERCREVRASTQLCNNGVIQGLIPNDQPIPAGWVKGQLPQKTEAHRQYQTGKSKSESTKAKIGDQHAGDKWFNNGSIEIHAKDCPVGWLPGRLPISEQTRINRGQAQKGLMWFTDGIQNRQFRTVSEAPMGWRRGRVLPPAKKPRKPRSNKWMWITDGKSDKQHEINNPIPEGFKQGKSKIYQGPKKVREDVTIYTLYHPKHGEVSATRKQFEEEWGISKGKFSRIRRVTKSKPYGWRMVK